MHALLIMKRDFLVSVQYINIGKTHYYNDFGSNNLVVNFYLDIINDILVERCTRSNKIIIIIGVTS